MAGRGFHSAAVELEKEGGVNRMNVAEFIQRQREADPVAAIGFFMDIYCLLDEYEGERCSTLRDKIRAQLEVNNKNGKTNQHD